MVVAILELITHHHSKMLDTTLRWWQGGWSGHSKRQQEELGRSRWWQGGWSGRSNLQQLMDRPPSPHPLVKPPPSKFFSSFSSVQAASLLSAPSRNTSAPPSIPRSRDAISSVQANRHRELCPEAPCFPSQPRTPPAPFSTIVCLNRRQAFLLVSALFTPVTTRSQDHHHKSQPYPPVSSSLRRRQKPRSVVHEARRNPLNEARRKSPWGKLGFLTRLQMTRRRIRSTTSDPHRRPASSPLVQSEASTSQSKTTIDSGLTELNQQLRLNQIEPGLNQNVDQS